MKIGLLSDTHGYLDRKVFEYFSDRDEVWHAGDIGTLKLAQELEQFKPLRAVHGNIDDLELQQKYPEDLWFTCDQTTVLITHIVGSPPHYNTRIKKILKDKKPDVLICGHSHILKVIPDKNYGMLYINPGAAGNQGFHHMRTLLRFEIRGKKISNMEVIELGRRGAIENAL